MTDDYLKDLEYRARRFSGAYTGTSGTLAGGIIHLIKERQSMQATIDQLEQDNAALREAVETRLAESETIPSDWILRGERELKGERERPEPRPLGAGMIANGGDETNEAERLLLTALNVIRDRRPKYGGPREHFKRTVGMINAAFADVLKRPLTTSDWALIMTLDKVARFLGPTKTADQITDLAGYAACLAECEAKP
jgi:hypothetical protein